MPLPRYFSLLTTAQLSSLLLLTADPCFPSTSHLIPQSSALSPPSLLFSIRPLPSLPPSLLTSHTPQPLPHPVAAPLQRCPSLIVSPLIPSHRSPAMCGAACCVSSRGRDSNVQFGRRKLQACSAEGVPRRHAGVRHQRVLQWTGGC
ncbi:hypothetical protein PVAP13_7KG113300 [Panicum virgatum]|uniref:Uncharacterized protein n=1 Tax=Panicum virgatum TaxID=38727 RepID=A0A8T0Q9E9_PANVG|nr:hypothetical protein PVAP13_7KG113300 [Panicum virgatum]